MTNHTYPQGLSPTVISELSLSDLRRAARNLGVASISVRLDEPPADGWNRDSADWQAVLLDWIDTTEDTELLRRRCIQVVQEDQARQNPGAFLPLDLLQTIERIDFRPLVLAHIVELAETPSLEESACFALADWPDLDWLNLLIADQPDIVTLAATRLVADLLIYDVRLLGARLAE